MLFFSRDENFYRFNGQVFTKVAPNSDPRPGFGVAIQRRLAVGGAPDKRTVVDISRVDEVDVFPADEDTASTSVLKAADIDIGNIIGTADEIKGLEFLKVIN